MGAVRKKRGGAVVRARTTISMDRELFRWALARVGKIEGVDNFSDYISWLIRHDRAAINSPPTATPAQNQSNRLVRVALRGDPPDPAKPSQ